MFDICAIQGLEGEANAINNVANSNKKQQKEKKESASMQIDSIIVEGEDKKKLRPSIVSDLLHIARKT